MVGRHARKAAGVHARSKVAGTEPGERCIPFPVSRAERKGTLEPDDAREYLKSRLALPVAKVAPLLGISSAAVRLMIARGGLPGKKVGGGEERITYIVPTGALLAWLDGAAAPPSSEDAA
jgi:hypothetical protein